MVFVLTACPLASNFMIKHKESVRADEERLWEEGKRLREGERGKGKHPGPGVGKAEQDVKDLEMGKLVR